jgi:Arm DNA-binding domain
MKLAHTRIESLKCPPGKRDVLVFDDEQRGLGVRVTAGGGKTYLAQFTFHGQKRRIPLGACSAVSLAKARDAVRTVMGDVAKGIDPAAERKKVITEARRKAAHKALTLSALFSDWQALHLASKRPSYAAEAVRALRNAFPRYLELPAADLDRAKVVKVLDAMARKGSAAMAARTAAYGKAAYGWAVKRGALSVNPFVSLPLSPTVNRERVLSDDELAAIWRATDDIGPFNGIVHFLILTGQSGRKWPVCNGRNCPRIFLHGPFLLAEPRTVQPISSHCPNRRGHCCAAFSNSMRWFFLVSVAHSTAGQRRKWLWTQSPA